MGIDTVGYRPPSPPSSDTHSRLPKLPVAALPDALHLAFERETCNSHDLNNNMKLRAVYDTLPSTLAFHRSSCTVSLRSPLALPCSLRFVMILAQQPLNLIRHPETLVALAPVAPDLRIWEVLLG